MLPIPYDTFDPSACEFPPPRVPLLPALTRASVGVAAALEFEPIGEGRERRGYTRGRYALCDAYRMCGVGPAGGLLAPAYHCRTMIDPAISLNAPISFYGLDERLVPDLDSVSRAIRAARGPVRAMLLTHYFGFAQDAAPVKALCDAHGIDLIEDCSHAAVNRRAERRIGVLGRYATISPYKMFPCEEGGLLVAGLGAPLPNVRVAGVRAELKTIANAAEHAWERHVARRGAADIERLDADIAAIVAAPIQRGVNARVADAGTSYNYSATEEGLSSSRVSRWLMRHCDVDRLAYRRRANYCRWVRALDGVAHCRPLFEHLPDDTVPYMFPLWIDHPRDHFFVLKKLGVPIWRWDDMAASDCAVSQRYREHVLHLPCHQALTEDELAWMTTAVAKVMRLGTSGPVAN